MNNGPSDEDYLQAKLQELHGPRHAVIASKIVQFRATKQVNRAAESTIYHQIIADIQAAKTESPR